MQQGSMNMRNFDSITVDPYEIDLTIPVEGPIGLLVDAQSSMNGRRFHAVSCEIIAIREEENVQIRKT
jgi:hypothetical protein